MKKILVAVAAVAVFSFGASAQEAKPAQQHDQQHHDQKKDEIFLKDGKVTQRVNGKESIVEKDITLKNGAVVTADGHLKTADGKVVALKEGDVVSQEGKVWSKKEAHENKVMKGEVTK